MPSVFIVGLGRVGTAFAIALDRSGYAVRELVSRRSDLPSETLSGLPHGVSISLPDETTALLSEIVLISTADRDIEAVSSSIKDRLRQDAVVLHTSGSLSSSILGSIRSSGRSVGSLHPLISFADRPSDQIVFKNAYIGIEGDLRAVKSAAEIARALGAIPVVIDVDHKALYHAAAVTACGHLVAVVDAAVEMMTKCGPTEQTALDMLIPLIESTVANLKAGTTGSAVTGSFARADADAVQRHLESLRSEVSDSAVEIYRVLGERSLEIAERNGIDPEAIAEVRNKLR